jgi:hypothetical protein
VAVRLHAAQVLLVDLAVDEAVVAGAAQHGNRVPQHEQLSVLGGR